MTSPSPTRPGDAVLAYRKKAESLAEDVAQRFRGVRDPEARSLTEAVHERLVAEANAELRQILTQLRVPFEIALGRPNAAERGVAIPEPKARALLVAIERASAIVEVCLDRATAAQLMIRLEREEFDLAEAIREFMDFDGLLAPDSGTALVAAPSPLVADRSKLVGVIGHLVHRFHSSAKDGEEVMVLVSPVEGGVEGFVGLRPSQSNRTSLMEELTAPVRIEDIHVDVAFARAVVERHGGTLFVAHAAGNALGFGFSIPDVPRAEAVE